PPGFRQSAFDPHAGDVPRHLPGRAAETRPMKLSDFDFDLPEGLIATRPVRPRPAARLLVVEAEGEGEALRDLHVRDLPDLLGPCDRLVLNDTRVIPARLAGTRERMTGQGTSVARIEATLLEPRPGGRWAALVKPLRKLKEGESIRFSDRLEARVERIAEGQAELSFDLPGPPLDAALAEGGQMPLPPYIAALRAPDARDAEDYQAVFARRSGAVAAPTASLHFDEALLARLAAKGVAFTHVTLHVGAGTFLPVKVEDLT